MKRMQGNDKGGEEKSGVSLYVNFLISFSYFKIDWKYLVFHANV